MFLSRWVCTILSLFPRIPEHLTPNNAVRLLEGIDESYHWLSHHGRSDEKLDQLAIVEHATIDRWLIF